MKYPANEMCVSDTTKVGGFTIIEIAVTFAILAILLATVLVGDNKSQEPFNLVNEAYNVAVFIREAQVKATSVISGSTDFDEAIGVHYGGGDRTMIESFNDANDDGVYAVGEKTGELTLHNKIKISNACGDGGCTSTGDPLHIVFKRPLIDAHITYGGHLNDTAVLCLSAPSGATVGVIVNSTGRIYVETDGSVTGC